MNSKSTQERRTDELVLSNRRKYIQLLEDQEKHNTQTTTVERDPNEQSGMIEMY